MPCSQVKIKPYTEDVLHCDLQATRTEKASKREDWIELRRSFVLTRRRRAAMVPVVEVG